MNFTVQKKRPLCRFAAVGAFVGGLLAAVMVGSPRRPGAMHFQKVVDHAFDTETSNQLSFHVQRHETLEILGGSGEGRLKLNAYLPTGAVVCADGGRLHRFCVCAVECGELSVLLVPHRDEARGTGRVSSGGSHGSGAIGLGYCCFCFCLGV